MFSRPNGCEVNPAVVYFEAAEHCKREKINLTRILNHEMEEHDKVLAVA
jgi:hypothetical protein